MIPITETDDLYPTTVPLLEVTDPVLGGPSGPSNAAAIALANRTRYLKAALDALGPGGGSVENVGTGIGLYVGTEGGALQLLTLLEGDNITLTALPTGLRIDAVAGGEGGGSSGRYKVITTDFGAIGDGSASSRSAFIAGHDSTPTTWPIVIPAGIYDLGGTDLVTDGRRYVLEGFVQFPNGKLRQSMFEQRDAMGSAEIWYDRGALMFETRTPFRLGGQSLTPALNIGSADPAQSAYGTVLFADGHSNFLALKPEERYNPVEINLYSYAYSGRANGVPGTNRLIRNTTSCPASMPFQSDMVGKYIYFQGVKLRVLSRVSDNEITVALLGGGAVSFDFATEATYHFTYTMFRGTCSTSGNAVTWKGGHKFFGYLESWNPTSLIVINGTAYTVSDVADMEHLTLATSAGVQNDVEWIGYAEVDGETTALRLNHAITGEQLTLMTSAGALDGLGACFLIKTDKGVGDWNPIVVQNGGVDGLAVVYHPGTNTTRIGIGIPRLWFWLLRVRVPSATPTFLL